MSLSAIEIIDRLPAEFAARLVADDYFCDIPVVVAEEGNVKLMMDRQQAVITAKGGKWGVAVVVLQIIEDDEFPNLPGGPMLLKPAFQVLENVEQNRSKSGTGKSHRQVGKRVLRLFKGSCLVGMTKQISAGKPAIEPIELGKEPAQVKGVQVNIECLEASNEPSGNVALPAILALGGDPPAAGITCATAGAEVWFTTDDSYPVPPSKQASTAQIYTGPVELAPGVTIVRAVGYKAGLVASWAAREEITVG